MRRASRRLAIAALAVATVAAAGPACSGGRSRPTHRIPCPTAPVVVTGDDAIRRLAGCTVLPGLTVRTAAPLALGGLDDVVRIEGDLVLGPSVAIEAAPFRRLEHVGGTVRIGSNAGLDGLALPRLTHAGAVVVEDNAELGAISLPVLRGVDGELRITRTPSLALVNLPALQRVGGRLAIVDARQLELVEAPALTRVGGVTLVGTALPRDQVAALVALAR